VATLERNPRAPMLGRWAGGYFYFSRKWAPWSFLRPRYVILIQGSTPTEPNTFAANVHLIGARRPRPEGRGEALPAFLWETLPVG
jgi:hypothetical protein